MNECKQVAVACQQDSGIVGGSSSVLGNGCTSRILMPSVHSLGVLLYLGLFFHELISAVARSAYYQLWLLVCQWVSSRRRRTLLWLPMLWPGLDSISVLFSTWHYLWNVYKVLHGLGPSNLKYLLTNTRPATLVIEREPSPHFASIGSMASGHQEESFPLLSCWLWHSLPLKIHQALMSQPCWKNLKMGLFRWTFS